MKTKGQIAIERLIDEGWEFSHTALVSIYQFAGTVSKMKTRNGFEFCRVHHGKCKNVDCGSFIKSMQITSVMRRPINPA